MLVTDSCVQLTVSMFSLYRAFSSAVVPRSAGLPRVNVTAVEARPEYSTL